MPSHWIKREIFMLSSPRNTGRRIVTSLRVTLGGCAGIFGPKSEDLGKRTFGTKIDDQMVESRGKANIKSAHPELEKSHVSLTSFNGIALLTGQVPSQ